MRKLTVLGVLLACVPLASAVGAPALPERGEATGLRDSASSAATNRVASTKTGRTADRAVPGGLGKGGVSKTRDAEPRAAAHRAVIPRSAAGRAASSNADRLHSLLNAQRRGRPIRQLTQSAGATRATGANLAAHGLPGTGPVLRPPTASGVAARPTTFSAPHAEGSGRLGGPATARTTHTAIINGTQLHHKY